MDEINKLKTIKEAIARAIVFFDLLDHPLTAYEIWKNLFFLPGQNNPKASLDQIVSILDSKELNDKLEERNGFYFFRGRSAFVEARQQSYIEASRKYKTAIRAAWWLRFIPGVKLVAVCNSLALGNIKKDSDIDFFIVTADNRIWLTRALVTAIVQILGARRHKQKIIDRICLSFYVAENNLDLKNVTLNLDPYFYYWMASLVPVFDDGCFLKFVGENDWLKEYLPNFSPIMPGASRKVASTFFSRSVKKIKGIFFYSFVGNFIENAARYLQLKKMSGNMHSVAGEKDTRVVISDSMLKFHEMDRREEYRRKWEEKMASLKIS